MNASKFQFFLKITIKHIFPTKKKEIKITGVSKKTLSSSALILMSLGNN